jgi:hypothetical protein
VEALALCRRGSSSILTKRGAGSKNTSAVEFVDLVVRSLGVLESFLMSSCPPDLTGDDWRCRKDKQ